MSYSSNPGELLQRFQLSEDDVLQRVSDIHIQEISCAKHIQWWLLPAVLIMENPNTIVKDIERERKSEKEMRIAFFSEWQRQKGSDASYKALISALLCIGSKEHAEYVCELLKRSTTARVTSQASEGSYSYGN